MSDATTFSGFPPAGRQFLRDLEANNNKEWFQANKTVYESQLLAPALDFVVALGTRLQELDPAIQFDTRTNGQGTLMRIYRDVRFSEDKSPYKTAVAGMFGDGAGKKTSRPGYGFHMTADNLELMAGMFQFDKEQLAAFRTAVDADGSGVALVEALDAVRAAGDYSFAGEHYKTVPKGFAADHPRADLLRYAGLYAYPAQGITSHLGDPALVDEAYGRFRDMVPVYDWLKRTVG